MALRIRLALPVAGLVLAALVAGPAAASPPDLSGTWTLDLDASQPVEKLLELQGVSFAERIAAAHMPVTQVLAQGPDTLRLEVRSPAKDHDEVLRLDGTWQTVDSERAGPLQTRSFWRDGALVTESRLTLPDGRPATLQVTRRLADDGRTLLQRIQLSADGGPSYAATRVFRRA